MLFKNKVYNYYGEILTVPSIDLQLYSYSICSILSPKYSET